MTARAFLVRGLLAGLIAGFAAFLVASPVGEPHVEAAIALEEAAAADTRRRGDATADHSRDAEDEEGTVGLPRQPAHLGPADRHPRPSASPSAASSALVAAVRRRPDRPARARASPRRCVALVGFVAVAPGAVPEVPRHATRRRQRRHHRRPHHASTSCSCWSRSLRRDRAVAARVPARRGRSAAYVAVLAGVAAVPRGRRRSLDC